MAQEPLHVLWIEPHFPGRLGAVADWLVRRRGYRSWVYCHTADPRDQWPASVGQGLELQVFGVGGVRASRPSPGRARWNAASATLTAAGKCSRSRGPAHRPDRRPLGRARFRALRTGLLRRPLPSSISSITIFTPPARPGRGSRPATCRLPIFTGGARSAAIDLLDLEQCDLAWTPTTGSATCSRPSTATISGSSTTVLTRRVRTSPSPAARAAGRRTIAGRVIPERNAGCQLRGPLARPPSRF